MVLFRQNSDTGEWDEFAWIRVQNQGVSTRRLSVVPPSNPSFVVHWAASLQERTKVPPGLWGHILVQFTPKSEDPITDELVIRVEGDGGIVVPIYASPQDPPILEIDDWDCGCCLIGKTNIQTFRIMNWGGIGRFWLLSEAEFMNEVREGINLTKCLHKQHVELLFPDFRNSGLALPSPNWSNGGRLH